MCETCSRIDERITYLKHLSSDERSVRDQLELEILQNALNHDL